jgi:CheY-like chemotaxis protein
MAKLLVADDLVPIRQMVRITLSTQGWTIVEAKNGNEALELVRSEKPDLVLLDVDMGPGPNGFDVCRQIKADEATKDIPVVMLTALDERPLAFALGAADYVAKPVVREELLRALGAVAARPRGVSVPAMAAPHDVTASAT